MNPKIKLYFTAVLCSFSSFLIAQPVTITTAKIIAEHHLASIPKPTLKSTGTQRSFQFTSVKAAVEDNDTLFYILNDTINKGFVIVSADQRAWPILGYSTEGSFDEKNQPEAFTAWLDNRKKEIEYIKKNNIEANSTTIASWKKLSLKSSAIETTSVKPLIKTQWDQGCYYNAMCPADESGPCGCALTGCTNTAMAQIMKYWNYPTKGNGSHAYTHPTYGNLSADFGSTTYQWSQMPNNVNGPNDAVATLMYHCGVSLDTEYGPNASGAWDPTDELVTYFNYSSNAMLVNREGYSTSEWTNLLRSELDLGHPIYYLGSCWVAHSFICDGYQVADYFHFNWGWSGFCDGYFYIGDLNPAGYTFNLNQYALVRLVPENLPDGYNGFFLSSNNLDIAFKGGTTTVDVCSSTNWTASSNQPWLSLSTNTGVSGKTTITLTAPENKTGNDRSATITITAAGFSDQLVTVNQLTTKNVTPGGLNKLIAGKSNSITHLSLTGSIDARDFKTMRDAMPALTDLDLSSVSIVAYTGDEGTNEGSTNCTYAANSIPIQAFNIIPCRGKNHLKSIILPPTLASIESSAFANCNYLTSINIPSTVSAISSVAFETCRVIITVDANNPHYSDSEGVLFNKNQTAIIHCSTSKTGSYTIPASVISIMENAFQYCADLTTVIIPSSVTNIRRSAFSNCNRLTDISIPASVKTIEIEAFRNCSALINVASNNPNFSSIDGVLLNKAQTTLIQYPTSKTGNYTIPSSVTCIGRYAFSYCDGLTGVTIPSTVTTIEMDAFEVCTGLTSVTIPSSVNTIENGTFNLCSGLTSITIPSSVISIGDLAFNDCSKLNSIFTYSISPINFPSSASVFNGVNKESCKLHVPIGSKDAYKQANVWNDFTIFEMPGLFLADHTLGMASNVDTIQTVIASSSDWTAVSNQTWLSITPTAGSAGKNTISLAAKENTTTTNRTATVTISAPGITTDTITVTQNSKIEVTAGNLRTLLSGQLSKIKNLTITGIIDERDFEIMRDQMPELTHIDLSGVTIAAYSIYPANGIPQYAFWDKSTGKGKIELKSIILPSSVNSIGDHAFSNCEGLTAIHIPDSVKTIGISAFNNCYKITAINIPAAVTYIGENAFIYFPGLINVAANNTKYSSIDGILFNKTQSDLIQCPTTQKGNYTIPSSVTAIGSYAFYFCNELTNISIPPLVTSIGIGAFSNCEKLTSINIPLSVTSLGIYAFTFCSKLTSIAIPSTVLSIGSGAFLGCSSLNSIYAYPISPVNLNSSNNVFDLVDKYACTLYVPFGSKTQYATAGQWKNFVNIVELPNQAPIADAGSDQAIDEGTLVTLNGAESTDTECSLLTYRWTAPAGINLDSNTVPELTFRAPRVTTDTNYTFSLVVNDGTFDSPFDQVVVTVLNVNNNDPNDSNDSTNLYVFPNPTTGPLEILTEGVEENISGIEVYNNNGQLKQITIESNMGTVSKIDLSSLANGIYLIKVTTKNQSFQKKVIKK